MHGTLLGLLSLLALLPAAGVSHPSTPLDVIQRYTLNQDHFKSWRMEYEATQKSTTTRDPNRIDMSYHTCDLRYDGERVFWRWRRWGGVEGTPHFTPKDNTHYLGILWDGQTHSSYRAKDQEGKGLIILDKNPRREDIDALLYDNMVGSFMGCHQNAFERVDEILRSANRTSLRDERQAVNGSECLVLDATTDYGEYTVWIDPGHGYNIAKAEIRARAAQKHLYRGRPVRAGESILKVDILRFEEFEGAWMAVEGTWEHSYDRHDGARQKTETHVRITDLTVAPDHEALRSFVRDDVPNGTAAYIAPFAHIRHTWEDGSLVPEFDGEAVGKIDEIVQEMLGHNDRDSDSMAQGKPQSDLPVPVERPDQELLPQTPVVETGAHAAEGMTDLQQVREEQTDAQQQDRAARKGRKVQHPHCGLYCVYTLVGLTGGQMDFSDLVKSEYLGQREGSSLWEVRKALLDHGLSAEPAARLTVGGLKKCPYRAILHVRAHPESPQYDHYELFLGVENGKARLFNPPQEPRLVEFKDLAPRWDGRAVVVSDGPVNIATVLAPDRQRWLTYAIVGVLVLVVAHFARWLWLSTVPSIPRRWALWVSSGQLAAIGLAALVCGTLCQFVSEAGLLSNASATQSLQRGYAGSFIPKVREGRVRELLGTKTVFVDARLAGDYERGHLEDAISLPIDANDVLWKATIEKIPRHAHIVTYCQSAGCKFAETVSLRLIEEGYSDVSIFKGGWAEWASKHGRSQSPAPVEKEVESDNAEQNDPA